MVDPPTPITDALCHVVSSNCKMVPLTSARLALMHLFNRHTRAAPHKEPSRRPFSYFRQSTSFWLRPDAEHWCYKSSQTETFTRLIMISRQRPAQVQSSDKASCTHVGADTIICLAAEGCCRAHAWQNWLVSGCIGTPCADYIFSFSTCRGCPGPHEHHFCNPMHMEDARSGRSQPTKCISAPVVHAWQCTLAEQQGVD